MENSQSRPLPSRIIYYATSNHSQLQDLERQVGYYGFALAGFNSLAALRTALDHELPVVAILDHSLLQDTSLEGSILWPNLGQLPRGIPVFLVTDRNDVTTRLAAVRSGAQGFFALPLDINELMEGIFRLISPDALVPFRVLIVDDSPIEAKLYSFQLRHHGMETEFVTDPLLILQPLSDFNPDLILLDMYMPECSGLDLARMIRQMERFVSIPIVFLSAETDKDKQLEAMSLGADDFLVKPIKPEHLIASIQTRAERYRRLRALMMNDSLTGLLNHTSLKMRLGQEVARAGRMQHPLALGMIDLDHFKRVNDTYRHATGDRVLRSLANFLRRRLRRTDIIGRYGGEEFSVIFPDTPGPAAAEVMRDLCAGFANILHRVDEDIEISVTFSAGVASFPHFSTAMSLSEAADQAMYAAKQQGRNQVCLAPGE